MPNIIKSQMNYYNRSY